LEGDVEAAMQGWQQVQVEPIDEPLVCLEPGERLLVEPIYRTRGHREALDAVYVRSRVAERLREASELLSPPFLLLVWDGWRPLELQKALYDAYAAALSESAGLLGGELARRLKPFVSEPSEDPRCPSPHLTGGAVDLTLASGAGVALNMGGEFDELSVRSKTDHYEHRPLSTAEIEIRDRRRLLCDVMSKTGFSNYPEEWWHFDLGNQFWGRLNRRPAYYGKIVPPGWETDVVPPPF
jgi:zinc D-Ala-D-Ala dipeptidase